MLEMIGQQLYMHYEASTQRQHQNTLPKHTASPFATNTTCYTLQNYCLQPPNSVQTTWVQHNPHAKRLTTQMYRQETDQAQTQQPTQTTSQAPYPRKYPVQIQNTQRPTSLKHYPMPHTAQMKHTPGKTLRTIQTHHLQAHPAQPQHTTKVHTWQITQHRWQYKRKHTSQTTTLTHFPILQTTQIQHTQHIQITKHHRLHYCNIHHKPHRQDTLPTGTNAIYTHHRHTTRHHRLHFCNTHKKLHKLQPRNTTHRHKHRKCHLDHFTATQYFTRTNKMHKHPKHKKQYPILACTTEHWLFNYE